MALNTYAALLASVASWLNRGDLTDQIPDFVTLAEGTFNRRIRNRRMETTRDVTVETETLALPADCIEVKSLAYDGPDGFVPLEPISIDTFLVDHSNVAGYPAAYAVDGANLRISPEPNDAYAGKLRYYAKVPALSDTNTSNWLLALAPDLYLYGALLESAPFLKDDARIGVWETRFEKALAELKLMSQRENIGGGRARIRHKPIG